MAKKGEPGSKRRDKDNYRRITPAQLRLFMEKNLESERDKALVATLWVTGARITELIGDEKKGIPAMTREQLYDVELEGATFVVFDELPCLKLKKKTKRTFAVPVDENHTYFLEIIASYIHNMKPTDVVFEMSRSMAWRIVNRCTGLWIHFIRHSRLTYLANEYGLDSMDLKKITGWSSSQMADNYVQLDWRRTAKKFL